MASPDDLTGGKTSLYAARKAVYPKRVDGPFRRLKWAIMAVTLAIYYGTPWIRWDRGPYAPDQAVLVDLAHRRFYMFQIEIWPHEFYYVAGLLIMAGIGLFLVTSAVGRAWCGYACPQTVWTDLFQHVDRLVDGDRNAQIQAAPVAYGTVAVLTATTFVLGGFMREQVCIYMCPWPRIQTAMMDEKSLLVTYREWRGEPRGSTKKAMAHPGAFGDCIDCNQCVAVCPTGIDIREGPQIGCITCALCIDACDGVMAQVGRPRGLIDYCTLEDVAAEKAGGTARPVRKTLFRPRTIIYFSIWCAIGAAMLFTLGQRTRLDLAVQHERSPLYVQLSDGHIRNNYTLKLRNMETRPRAVEVTVSGLKDAALWTEEGSRVTAAQRITLTLAPDSVTRVKLFVAAPAAGAARQDFTIATRGLDGDPRGDSETIQFDRPPVDNQEPGQ
jgi:polyferredoxin